MISTCHNSDSKALAEQMVQRWTIRSIGNRPQDHLVRDNLFASLIRDLRAKTYQALLRKPHDWMQASLGHLATRDRQLGLEVVALNYLYQQMYASFLARSAADDDCLTRPDILRTVRRAQECCPVGAFLVPRAMPQTADWFVCNQSHLCPWCHGRKVLALYESLSHSFADENPLRWLLQIKLDIREDDLPGGCVGRWSQAMCDRDQSRNADDYYSTLRTAIDYVQAEIKEQLREKARTLGLAGGIFTYQLGPDKSSDGQFGFRHSLGLLGEISFDSESAEYRYFQAAQPETAKFAICGRWVRASVLAVPTVDRHAFRLLVAGSSVSYPTESLGCRSNLDSLVPEERRFHDGLPGVVSLQPLYLLDRRRLQEYVNAMKGVHLFDRFGCWREARSGNDEPHRVEPPSIANLASRQQRSSTRRRLKSYNDVRHQEAQTRRATQLEATKQVWPEVQRQARSKPGRPAYRTILASVLKQQGFDVNERDARHLVSQLTRTAEAETTAA